MPGSAGRSILSLGNFQFVPGVAARLRLVFLSVSVVLISTVLLGYFQITNLYKTTDVLTENSVPVFVRTQEIERNLRSLVLSLQTVESVKNDEDLQPIKDSLGEQLRVLQLNIESLKQRDITPQAVEKMAEALGQTSTNIDQMLKIKKEVLLFEREIAQVKSLLKREHAAVRYALKKASNQMAVPLRETDIPELAFEIEALIETAVRLDRILDIDAVREITEDMRSKTQEISFLISQLPATSAQDTLKSGFASIREVIFGDDGVSKLALQLQTLRRTLSDQSLKENGLIAAISTNSDDLVLAARTRVNDAALSLEATANRLIVSLAAASIASLIVFWFANFLIVEKQINQRMSRLTQAVSAIAANESDYVVDVDGNDELGDMAHALETFKSTAEELRRSNTELEKFAYVAAHDLRSPLRAIQDLAEWTIEDKENQFSEEGRENMSLLQKRVDRLNRLLSDLLAYSRVGKESQDRTQISLPKIIQEIREMLDPNGIHKITYAGIRQPIITFTTPLRQVLLNLISNSIKHHNANSCKIEIAGELTDGRLLISVEGRRAGYRKAIS